MQHLASYLYLIGYSFAIFVLISLGLAVIFGMMRVINLAQGEFLMLGAYVCVEATKGGLPLWGSIVAAGFAVGLFGILVERLIIRFLYGRLLDTLLATWGLSLFLVGGVTILYGPQSESVGVTTGSFRLGDIAYSGYSPRRSRPVMPSGSRRSSTIAISSTATSLTTVLLLKLTMPSIVPNSADAPLVPSNGNGPPAITVMKALAM